jgi:GNAT superfamily N-acetyltransferase
MNSPIEVRSITTAETYPLRLSVLRPNRPLEAAQFPGDDLPDTKHFGAFRDGQLVGIASLFVAEMPEHPGEPALQLRGMATAPEVRGQGFGRALVLECLAHAKSQHVKIFWFNARLVALGFYRKLDFKIIGDKFAIPDVGPHFRMWQRLEPVPALTGL